MEPAELAQRIDDLHPHRRALVAIDGSDAAGKTTLADRLAELVRRPVVRASVDGWHRPRDVRYRRGRDSPEGCYRDSYDYPALITRLLEPFAADDSSVLTAAFDHSTDGPCETWATGVPLDAVLLVDGVFLQRPELRAHWDLVIHLAVPPDVCLARALVRDGADAEARYRSRYLPAQELYRAEVDPERRADLVLHHRSGSDSTA